MTLRGWGVLAGSLIALVVGLLLGYQGLFAVAVVGVLLPLLCLAAVRIRPSLGVTRTLRSPRVERCAQSAGAALIVNEGRMRTGALTANDHIAGTVVPFMVPGLRPRATSTATFYIPTERRGRLELGPLVLTNADSFGFARRDVDMGEIAEIVVTPRVLATPDVRGSLLRSVDGAEAQSNIEGTLAFHTLREYVPGDDLRHVHWKSSARGAGLLVKQHVDTARPGVALICDHVLSDDPDRHEHLDVMIDCLASLATSALSRSQPVWLHTGRLSHTYRPAGTACDAVADMVDTLTAIQAVEALPDTRLLGLTGAIHAATAAGPGSLAVLATSNPVGTLPAQVQALANRYAVALVVHSDTAQPLRQQGRVWYLGVGSVDELPTRLVETGLFA